MGVCFWDFTMEGMGPFHQKENRMQEFVKALGEAIKDLEEGREHYFWGEPASCNCGLIVKHLLSKEEIAVLLTEDYGWTESVIELSGLGEEPETWTKVVNSCLEYCPQTGIPIVTLFRKLIEKGMSLALIEEIEYLGDQSIRKEAGIDEDGEAYQLEENVLAYFKVLYKRLQEENND